MNNLTFFNMVSFKDSLDALILEIHPKKIIETGTFLGQGSTLILAEALDRESENYEMYTIEVNSEYAAEARENLKSFLNVHVLEGLSIPRSMLLDELETESFLSSFQGGIYIDFFGPKRASQYVEECAFDGSDDLLGLSLKTFGFCPDLVLLDSAGHLGFVEFNYVLSLLKGSCYFILDDVFHVKHHLSLNLMSNDKRFEIKKISNERFGFCIAKFVGS